MKNLKQLLHLADLRHFRRDPPTQFLKELGIENKPKRFKIAAWRLFRDRRRVITLEEVASFIESRSTGGDNSTYEIGAVASHFLDSGSFTLWTEAAKYGKEHNCSKWDYYHTPEFWNYIDSYADFVKEYRIGIDHFANVDVIPNPVLTYRNQLYLELEHGLKPVPVVHYTTDLRWLHKYIDEGYEFIALGGLVGSMSKPSCVAWIDRAFDIICNTPDSLPRVKIHGFGVTNHAMLWRYPWWSVDSTVWTKMGAYGEIIIPPMRNGEWQYSIPPFKVPVSMDSVVDGHYLLMSKAEQHIVREWLKFIGMKIGKLGDEGEVLEYGVMTRHTDRRAANLHYFEHMRKAIPEYPWAWKKKKHGMGFV